MKQPEGGMHRKTPNAVPISGCRKSSKSRQDSSLQRESDDNPSLPTRRKWEIAERDATWSMAHHKAVLIQNHP